MPENTALSARCVLENTSRSDGWKAKGVTHDVLSRPELLDHANILTSSVDSKGRDLELELTVEEFWELGERERAVRWSEEREEVVSREGRGEEFGSKGGGDGRGVGDEVLEGSGKHSGWSGRLREERREDARGREEGGGGGRRRRWDEAHLSAILSKLAGSKRPKSPVMMTAEAPVSLLMRKRNRRKGREAREHGSFDGGGGRRRRSELDGRKEPANTHTSRFNLRKGDRWVDQLSEMLLVLVSPCMYSL